jgi:hypothetical protein
MWMGAPEASFGAQPNAIEIRRSARLSAVVPKEDYGLSLPVPVPTLVVLVVVAALVGIAVAVLPANWPAGSAP